MTMAAIASAGPSPAVLDVQGLTTSLWHDGRWRPVVRDVSFSIATGETLALVGESGSGKSMTALSVMRLLPAGTTQVSGRISLGKLDLLGLPQEALRRVRGNEIAMIFQEPSLNPVFTVGFHLVETLRHHRGLVGTTARRRAIELLERVRIPDAARRLDDYPHQFSGGMRQRVMIAIALACHPKLLIADEPTTALDVTVQAQVLALIKELQQQERMSVLFITHDMGVVAEMADRTAVMRDGVIVESAATASLFAGCRHPYTQALLAAVPRLGEMNGQQRPMRLGFVDPASTMQRPVEPAQAAVDESIGPVLRVHNLTTRFPIRGGLLGRPAGCVHAVEKVSFDVRAGETLSLVGESGCGKSTTGRSIVGLVQPAGGAIIVDGIDASAGKAAKRRIRRRLQMVFQDPVTSLNAKLTVGAAIAEPLLVHGIVPRQAVRERVADLLTSVGLSPDMAGRFPHEFSGGQRQRISIARALALEPKVIIADEAVSALDVSVKAQVINLLLDLQARLGLSYLFISHDIAVVERISHRVGVMYLGEIVEIGPRASVFGNPQHPYTRKLLEAVPIPDPARRGLAQRITDTELRSPIRPLDYRPPPRHYREVTPGHLVQLSGEEGM
jgi:peptide/nickel transport system ATP-binding protein